MGPDGRWQPGIGDPTFIGWLTVVAYAFACVCSVRAALLARNALRSHTSTNPKLAREELSLLLLWGASALVMLGLGVNKQLDLQSWLTQVARDMAHEGGWYDQRRVVQLGFIGVMILFGVFGMLAMGLLLRHVRTRALWTILGLGAVMSFVIVRAASFHHVDILISTRILGLRVNWILELGGIAMVAFATLRAAREYRRAKGPS